MLLAAADDVRKRAHAAGRIVGFQECVESGLELGAEYARAHLLKLLRRRQVAGIDDGGARRCELRQRSFEQRHDVGEVRSCGDLAPRHADAHAGEINNSARIRQCGLCVDQGQAIARVGACQDRGDERGIGDAAGEGTGRILARHQRHDAGTADETGARLIADDRGVARRCLD
jgi:hypothetical protein